MTKPAKNVPKTTDGTDEPTLKVLSGTLEIGARQIDSYVRKDPSNTLTAINAAELAKLLTQIATVIDALRKADAAARRADGDMTASQMLDRIRRMPSAERAQFLRTAHGVDADSGKSGLA